MDPDDKDDFGKKLFQLCQNSDIKNLTKHLGKVEGYDKEIFEWTNNGGMTPLAQACSSSKESLCLEMAELLLARKVNINSTNKYGVTVLMAAAKRGHPNLCAFLIEKGADYEATDNKGKQAHSMSQSPAVQEVFQAAFKKRDDAIRAKVTAETAECSVRSDLIPIA
jgi:ankyrin repeat protein